ncbi:methyl-accepting chemotaxis protein [Ferdinandcohnia quinoae]|uniref:Methyl-accepting chemotaxis protein n=1 Tax=Fredinandcohnia quinoae TaxID=2918902 RepID=A0AAW5EEN8_9BACI|nr:methyl-accepting chemotaxis protein [Fredinandcohnia sp. SECRCQ15]MCH1627971.1 methyl-accepting chemotaxis protein [Fredinandcohnia sp. SECRCQ15]
MKSIRMKLIISFLIVILFCTGLSTYNYYSLKSMNNQTDEIVSKELPLLMSNENLAFNIAQSIALSRAYILYGDEFYKSEFEKNITLGKKMQEDILKYDPSPEVKGLIEKSNEWQRMVSEEVFNTYDGGYEGLAEGILTNKVEPIANELIKSFKELSKTRQEGILADGNDILNSGKTSQIIGISVAIAALIIGLAIASFTAEAISRPVKKMVKRMNAIANGELSSEVMTTKSKDEIGQLIRAINTMNTSLSSMVKQMVNVSDHVSNQSEELTQYADEVMAGSQQIATTMDELSRGAEEQAHASSSLNETMSQFAQEIMLVVGSGEDIKVQAESMLKMTDDGSQYMEKSISKMEDINGKMKHSLNLVKGLDSKTNNISELVKVIKEIAEQTNLLALNAAIEAARAGEHGRGFAVVADEVRKLAEQVSHSITDITSFVTDIQNESRLVVASLDEGYQFVHEGTDQIQTTGQTFENIKNTIDQVGTKIEEMATSLYNVLDNTRTINESIENIASVSEESAAAIEQVSATAQQSGSSMDEVSRSAKTLEDNAAKLNTLIQQFKL